MTTIGRVAKQTLIALAVVIIVGGIGWAGYSAVSDPAPIPTIDPRSLLDPIEVRSVDLIEVREGDFDVVARIRNPNTEYGAASFRYQIELVNDQGIAVYQLEDTSYILPGQSKYIVHTALVAPDAQQVVMTIHSADWQQLDVIGQEGVTLITTEDSYSLAAEDFIYSQAQGSVANSSDFDVETVDVVIVLTNRLDDPIAVNMTQINTFLAGTQRGFSVTWFEPFFEVVDDIHIEAYTNVFENTNFIRTHGMPERFQQLF